MRKRIRVGIIGCGAISDSHIKGYLSFPERAQIVATCDIIKERAQSKAEKVMSEYTKRGHQVTDKKGIPEKREATRVRQDLFLEYSKNDVQVFTDFNKMLELPILDAVSVCTPPFTHAPITIAAAKAGKHIYCEKPMALNATEAKAMRDECDKKGVKLGYQSGGMRLGAKNYAIRNYIVSGKLGDVYYGRMTNFRVRGRPGIDILTDSKWFIDSRKAGGGVLQDIGVYDIDRVLYLLGDPQPVTVSSIAYRGIGEPVDIGGYVYDVEEHATVFVRFENGMSFTFEEGWTTNMPDVRGLYIFGAKGAFKGDALFIEKDKKIIEKKLEIPSIPNPDKIGDFLNACTGGARPISTGEDGVKVMEIISGALLSAKLGREITIPELYAIEKIHSEPGGGWSI